VTARARRSDRQDLPVELAHRIEELWLAGAVDAAPIEEAIRLLDSGAIRVAEPSQPASDRS